MIIVLLILLHHHQGTWPKGFQYSVQSDKFSSGLHTQSVFFNLLHVFKKILHSICWTQKSLKFHPQCHVHCHLFLLLRTLARSGEGTVQRDGSSPKEKEVGEKRPLGRCCL